MENTAYRTGQISRIDAALKLAQQARDISKELHTFSAESRQNTDAKQDDFAEDSLKYFDTSYSQGQVERLRLKLNDLKKQLIEIKVSNDQLLFEGGFLLCIDQKIDDIFLSNTLCLLQASDENAKHVMDDTITKLTELRALVEGESQT